MSNLCKDCHYIARHHISPRSQRVLRAAHENSRTVYCGMADGRGRGSDRRTSSCFLGRSQQTLRSQTDISLWHTFREKQKPRGKKTFRAPAGEFTKAFESRSAVLPTSAVVTTWSVFSHTAHISGACRKVSGKPGVP